MPPVARPASSTYWTPQSNRQRRLSDVPPSNRNYSAPRTAEGDILSNISASTSRHYVDPWDLENYAFMRRHCTTDAETDYVAGSTPALESSQSDFYYVPQFNRRSCPDTDDEDVTKHLPCYLNDPSSSAQSGSIGLVNGVEEEDFYNERFELSHNSCCSPGNVENSVYCVDRVPRSKYKPTSCLYSHTGMSVT